MPIYAFACAHCGHHFDKLQKLADADPTQCPHCGQSGGVHRQLTAPQFRLAGSGWYETDFKSKSEHQHNLAGDAGKPADSKSQASKPVEPKSTESKPAESKPAA